MSPKPRRRGRLWARLYAGLFGVEAPGNETDEDGKDDEDADENRPSATDAGDDRADPDDR